MLREAKKTRSKFSDLCMKKENKLREAKKQGPNFQRLVHEKRPFAPLKKTCSGKRKKQGPNFQRLVHEKRPFAPPKKHAPGSEKNKVQIFRDLCMKKDLLHR